MSVFWPCICNVSGVIFFTSSLAMNELQKWPTNLIITLDIASLGLVNCCTYPLLLVSLIGYIATGCPILNTSQWPTLSAYRFDSLPLGRPISDVNIESSFLCNSNLHCILSNKWNLGVYKSGRISNPLHNGHLCSFSFDDCQSGRISNPLHNGHLCSFSFDDSHNTTLKYG